MGHVAALIVAAGSGDRLPGNTPKQLRLIAGRPMVAWSVERMASAGISSIVVVATPGHEDETRAAVGGATVVAGGDTRQVSVWNGLGALPAGASHVLVHDAARPCVSRELIDRVVAALSNCAAVVPSVPVVDTLVREANGRVEAIVDRNHVAGVQTPQGFSVALLRRAHEAARRREFVSSDDGSLVLAIGEPVATVPGERNNIKVTFTEDLRVAEAILNDDN